MIGGTYAIACTTTTSYTANNMQVYNNRSLTPIIINGMRGDIFTGNTFGNAFTDNDVIYLFNSFAKTDITYALNKPFIFNTGFSDPGTRSRIYIRNGVIEQIVLFVTKNSNFSEGDSPCTCSLNMTNGVEFCSPYVTYTQAQDKTITPTVNTLEVISRGNSFSIYGVTNFPSKNIAVSF